MRSTKVASAASASALIVLLIVSGCSYSFTGKTLNVGVASAGVADMVTTVHAIEQGRGREGNPFMGQSLWQQAAVKLGGIGYVIGMAALLERHELQAWAHVLRGVAIVTWTSVAIHNGRVGR